MNLANNEKIKAFVSACHRAAGYGLLRHGSGNMSYRLDETLVASSASGVWLSDITSQQVAVCKLEDGTCINDKIPTVENGFHLGILRERPQLNVVLHFQSPFATAIACGNPSEYDFFLIPEIPFYVGQTAVVEYEPPGSVELAQAVVLAMKEHDMVIIRNHGLVTVGKDFDDAIQRAGFFELACQILICQNKPQFLTQSAVNQLIERARYSAPSQEPESFK